MKSLYIRNTRNLKRYRIGHSEEITCRIDADLLNKTIRQMVPILSLIAIGKYFEGKR
jgi:hypothetical protein